MREILHQLLQITAQGRPVAYCRLVETRGSTPQKAGAMMLVFPNGSQAGTLGGGCVEAEVKRQSLRVLDQEEPQIATFKLDSDYGWDDGLICGGRMRILIVPLHGNDSIEYFQQLGKMADSGKAGTEAVIFDGQAAALKPATSYLLDADDRWVASLSGNQENSLPAQIRENLRPIATRPRAYAAAGVGYLPWLPRPRLVIIGGGHIGQAVAALVENLDFEVWVIDDREDCITQERFPSVARRIAGAVGEVLPALEITSSTYCLIVTRGHNHDEESLFHLADRGAAYVGMIGSKRKIRMIFEDLLAEGVSTESLAKVYAPLGIDLGSQTVPEIAISIVAELISHRNRSGHVPGRSAPIEIGPTA